MNIELVFGSSEMRKKRRAEKMSTVKWTKSPPQIKVNENTGKIKNKANEKCKRAVTTAEKD